MCAGLRKFSQECIHQSQRCVSKIIMTGNILEIETVAIAHHACLVTTVQSFSLISRVPTLSSTTKKRALQEKKNFEESVVLSVQRRRRSRKAVSSTWNSKRQVCKLALQKQRNVQCGTLNHRKGLFQAMEEESQGHALEIEERFEK